jgi:hypothetical protein
MPVEPFPAPPPGRRFSRNLTLKIPATFAGMNYSLYFCLMEKRQLSPLRVSASSTAAHTACISGAAFSAFQDRDIFP